MLKAMQNKQKCIFSVQPSDIKLILLRKVLISSKFEEWIKCYGF